jgi:hypothetical protein
VIPLKYVDLKGEKQVTDIDSLVDIVRGPSGKQHGWRALITYAPREGMFLELRDAPPDVRGDSRSEAEEVSASYLESTFGLSTEQIKRLCDRPHDWILLER